MKAPYETTHVRIPVPIKNQVEKLIEEFRNGGESEEEKPLTGLSDLDTAVEEAKKILVQKKSARVSMEKLLTAIYGQEVKL